MLTFLIIILYKNQIFISLADCKECLKGCFCDSGFVRDRKQNNRCVKPVKCKGIRVSEKMLARNRSFNCGRNQIYKKCGTDCGQRCRDSRRRRNCHKWKCTSGCFCGKGYFRNKMNNCVKPDKCRTTTRFQLFPKNWKFWRK